MFLFEFKVKSLLYFYINFLGGALSIFLKNSQFAITFLLFFKDANAIFFFYILSFSIKQKVFCKIVSIVLLFMLGNIGLFSHDCY